MSRFAAQAEFHGVARNCHWAGWVKPTDVSSWMACGDLLVVPSREGSSGWKEAQGLVVVEAMLVGVPVVASRLGGLTDMVEDGVTGRLVSWGTPLELAKTLESALSDDVTLRGYAGIGKRRAMELFSTQSVADGMRDLYENLKNDESRVSPFFL